MITGFLPTLGTLVVAQASGAGTGVAIVVAVVGAVLGVVGLMRARTLQQQVAAAKKERETALESTKALQARERELAKKAEERQDEAREVKQEIAGLRKKNHAAQEEMKALREQLKAQAEERDRLLASRPAFTEPAPAPRKEAKPTPKPAPVKVEPPAPAPVVVAPAPAPEPVRPPPAANPDLEARVVTLETERQTLSMALETERQNVKGLKNELQRTRHYAEQLRRIDMISKGKVEVLEDRVASLGRQFYEAVSELAAVKGEVRPPRGGAPGKGPRPPRRDDRRKGKGDGAAAAAGTEADTDPSHATPESDSLAAQMDAAEADAGVSTEPGADTGAAQQG
jgi:hypothetical protein